MRSASTHKGCAIAANHVRDRDELAPIKDTGKPSQRLSNCSQTVSFALAARRTVKRNVSRMCKRRSQQLPLQFLRYRIGVFIPEQQTSHRIKCFARKRDI